MKLHVFTVLDKAVGAYLPPFFARAKGEALRSFTEACSDANHQFAKNKVDYVLMYLGEFDDNSGVFDTREPERMLGAHEIVPGHERQSGDRTLDTVDLRPMKAVN